jgi:hypothetical protein
MLRVCRKGDGEGGQALSADEDRALRLAFGRFAKPEARSAGAAVVRRYQHLGFGNWLFCDCQDSGCRPPALIPVLESYVNQLRSATPHPTTLNILTYKQRFRSGWGPDRRKSGPPPSHALLQLFQRVASVPKRDPVSVPIHNLRCIRSLLGRAWPGVVQNVDRWKYTASGPLIVLRAVWRTLAREDEDFGRV